MYLYLIWRFFTRKNIRDTIDEATRHPGFRTIFNARCSILALRYIVTYTRASSKHDNVIGSYYIYIYMFEKSVYIFV